MQRGRTIKRDIIMDGKIAIIVLIGSHERSAFI